MPEIDVSEDQLAYLEEVRSALAESVTYGRVRHRDALQYLIDCREGNVSDDLDAPAGGEATDSAGSVDEPVVDPEDDVDVDADADADTPTVESAELEESSTGGGSLPDPETVEVDAESETPEPESETDGSESETADGETADPAESIASGGDDRLQAMMNLLDTYDEHWDESDAEDARYEVTLPDGGVEYARTKDDVRSILFKHYR